MKRTLSPYFTKMASLHFLSAALVLLLWFSSPATDPDEMAFARNLENLFSFLFFALLPLLQYLILFLPKSFRGAVWIFPALMAALFIYCWIIVATAPGQTATGSWISWNEPSRQDELLFILILLAPALLSSCSAGWGISPNTAGRIIFTAALSILAAANIHLTILSKHYPYLVVLLLLAAMARILYLFPKSPKPESPVSPE